MKRISTKRAKSTQITSRVKKAVYERDRGLCVVCGRAGIPEAHYIPRSKGGLGIEQNIVCLCRGCHDRFDFGDRETSETMGDIIRIYLESEYPDWDFPKYPGGSELELQNSKLTYTKYEGWEWNHETDG